MRLEPSMIGVGYRPAVISRSALCPPMLALCAILMTASAHAEVQNARIALDWIIQGTHAPFFVAKDKGYFKAEAVAVDAIGAGTAVHDTASILFKAAHAENVKVNWIAVQPQLFGPMLRRGDVDGSGGFTNSNVPAMLEMGFRLDDLFVVKYSDFGADMY